MGCRNATDRQTKAAFRFVGDAVKPGQITRLLGIEPSEAHEKGAPVAAHPERKHPTGLWMLKSSLSPDQQLQEHLGELLAILLPKDREVRAVVQTGIAATFYCALFATCPDYDGYFALRPDMLRAIAELGAELEVHVYCLGG